MLNIGCGASPTPGWDNYDNSLTVRIAQYPRLLRLLSKGVLVPPSQSCFAAVAASEGVRWANATRHIPAATCSAGAVYSSHMFEHLDQQAARRFLDEVWRVLVPGGTLRLAVPDLAMLVDSYKSTGDADALIHGMHLTLPARRGLVARLRWLAIGDRHHAWMYDESSLTAALTAAGFQGAVRLPAGQTTVPNPGQLNLREREGESLYVEARKPDRGGRDHQRSAGGVVG